MSNKHSTDPTDRLRRIKVRLSVACKKCGASPGQKCFSVRKSGHVHIRSRSHRERWDAFNIYKEVA